MSYNLESLESELKEKLQVNQFYSVTTALIDNVAYIVMIAYKEDEPSYFDKTILESIGNSIAGNPLVANLKVKDKLENN